MNTVVTTPRKEYDLRPYQHEALETMRDYEGHSGLLVIATGLGKTAIFTEYVRREVRDSDHHCLLLSHRAELVMQPLSYLTDIPCGIELAEKHADYQPIISASVQSLVGRLKKYNPREIDTIIVDEAHHTAAPTYRRILEYFEGARIFGFTATAHRGDGVGLGCVYDSLIFERNTLWGINNHFLTPMECFQVHLKYDMGSVKINEYGEFNQGDVARVMSGTAAGVLEAYETYAKGQTIIFAASLDEAQDITELINRKSGKEIAASVFGTTKKRENILQAFKHGRIKVLVNFGVLTEGIDAPCIETVLIARPISHTNVGLYSQMVGRGLRLHPGKEKCRIIDCVGISDVPICTAATLIGKEPLEPQPEVPKKETQPEEKQIAVLDTIPDTWVKAKKEVDIMEKGIGTDMHDVAWIETKNGGYVLPIPNVTYRISRPVEDGKVYLHKNKKSSKIPMPPQFIFDYVYQDLLKNHANARYLWEKNRRRFWDKEKATYKQIALIKTLSPDTVVDKDKMTRGDASEMIRHLLYLKEGQ